MCVPKGGQKAARKAGEEGVADVVARWSGGAGSLMNWQRRRHGTLAGAPQRWGGGGSSAGEA